MDKNQREGSKYEEERGRENQNKMEDREGSKLECGREGIKQEKKGGREGRRQGRKRRRKGRKRRKRRRNQEPKLHFLASHIHQQLCEFYFLY